LPKFSFVPRQEKFFDLFVESAQNGVKAARSLKDMLDNWENIGVKVAEITEFEHEGDSITHQIMALLHRSFITPFDREDIAMLSHTMDDITDFIHATADAIFIYKIDKPTQRARELADIIVEAALEVEKAVTLLKNHSDLKKVMEHCVELNRLENRADKVYRAALGELFDEDKEDTTNIIKWREIYEHMESATDRCEDVANVLEGVALKHA
jgi:predicted phosphate transport protein (TIGR00153 family)